LKEAMTGQVCQNINHVAWLNRGLIFDQDHNGCSLAWNKLWPTDFDFSPWQNDSINTNFNCHAD